MSFTLAELAKHTGAKPKGDKSYQVNGVADLKSATPSDISFLASSPHTPLPPKYTSLLSTTNAGIVCISEDADAAAHRNYLISSNPSHTFQEIVKLFVQKRATSGFVGVHETAVIHETATIGKGVTVGPYAVIDAQATVGDGSVITAHVFIGTGSVIGKACLIHPHATVRECCELGDRVILQPGAVVGSCGFGYLTDKEGKHAKLEQLGNVILEDDVEIGANTTIDRARFKTTRVRQGTKIDNLVQIAHNVELGPHNLLAAQTGIAGTVKTGRSVVMGGQAGVVGHVEIGDFVMIATRGGVSKPISKSGKYAGAPVMSLTDHNKTQVHLRKLEGYVKKLAELEKRLAALETQDACT